MKLVSSKETFEFRHNGDTLVEISPKPQKVTDACAIHLTETFGGLIQVSEVPVVDVEPEGKTKTIEETAEEKTEVEGSPVVDPLNQEVN